MKITYYWKIKVVLDKNILLTIFFLYIPYSNTTKTRKENFTAALLTSQKHSTMFGG